MIPRLELLDGPLLERIFAEAILILEDPGIRAQAPEVVELLTAAGARVDSGVARIPERLVQAALASVPRSFVLYDRVGNPAVRYGQETHFAPGSSCVNVLDPETLERRPAQTCELVRLVAIAEQLPEFAAQSTAVVCSDFPQQLGDIYRLFVVLNHSAKPVVTGAFSAESLPAMIELLAADAGSAVELQAKPRAIFDVCPSAPLNWSEFAAENLVQLARAGVPAEIVSVPIAGATAPVTLAGAIVQHAAETLAGIVIHQLAAPGAPVVWGGAPAILDMRSGSAAMGAMETAMLNIACAQVGRSLGLPTHGYLVATDSKLVDAQSGMESAVSTMLGALAGISMISGAGMLDSLACHSPEKLVLDAEAIASARRLTSGIVARADSLAAATLAQVAHRADFLRLPETRSLFRLEQHLPDDVIDRAPLQEGAATDAFARARSRVAELLGSYHRPPLEAAAEAQLRSILAREAKRQAVELPTIREVPGTATPAALSSR